MLTDHSTISPSISTEMRAIFDAHFAMTWRYMAQRGVGRDQLDQLVRDVFRVVREHPGRHDDKLPVRVLVCMVCHQVLRGFRERTHTLAPCIPDVDVDAPTEAFGGSATSLLLDAAIESLGEIEREIYLLFEGERIPLSEVSEALGVPEAEVVRKYASAKREVSGFVAKLRKDSASNSPDTSYARDLLRASQLRRSPSARDAGRVLAALIASSFAAPAGAGARSAAEPPPISSPTSSAGSGRERTRTTLRPVARSFGLERPTRRPYWLAGGLALAACGAGAYLLMGSTSAADRFTGQPVQARMKLEWPETKDQAERASPAPAPGPAETAAKAGSRPGAFEPGSSTAAPAGEAAALGESAIEEARHVAAEPGVEAPHEAPELADPGARAAEQGMEAGERAMQPDDPAMKAGDQVTKTSPEGPAAKATREPPTSQGDSEHAARAEATQETRPSATTSKAIVRAAARARQLCANDRHDEAREIVLDLEAKEAPPDVLEAISRICLGIEP